MPQLLKRGKHVFGWSVVSSDGRIAVPGEALDEYRLKESDRLLLLPGSSTSGGFALGSRESVGRSPIGTLLEAIPDLDKFRLPEGEALEYNGKPYCWVRLSKGGATVPPHTLKEYGIRPGQSLLVIRGSGLAIGFAAQGPILQEAEKHPELEVFQPDTEPL